MYDWIWNPSLIYNDLETRIPYPRSQKRNKLTIIRCRAELLLDLTSYIIYNNNSKQYLINLIIILYFSAQLRSCRTRSCCICFPIYIIVICVDLLACARNGVRWPTTTDCGKECHWDQSTQDCTSTTWTHSCRSSEWGRTDNHSPLHWKYKNISANF